MNENLEIWQVLMNGPLTKRGGRKPEYPEKPPDNQSDNRYEVKPFDIGDKFAWSELWSYTKSVGTGDIPEWKLTVIWAMGTGLTIYIYIGKRNIEPTQKKRRRIRFLRLSAQKLCWERPDKRRTYNKANRTKVARRISFLTHHTRKADPSRSSLAPLPDTAEGRGHHELLTSDLARRLGGGPPRGPYVNTIQAKQPAPLGPS